MARISQDEINRVKSTVSLLDWVRGQGYEVKKQGKDYAVLCPFHDEKTPLMMISPAKNVYHCFGCGAKGSVIDWVMKTLSVSFPHAMELLREFAGNPKVAAPAHPAPAAYRSSMNIKRSGMTHLDLEPLCPSDADGQSALQSVVSLYHQNLLNTTEGMKYLEKRGLMHPELVKHFKLGLSTKNLVYRLPAKHTIAGKQIRQTLRNIGVFRESGYEHFAGCLVVPVLDERSQVQELYGRRISPKSEKNQRHWYLPGAHRGVFNLPVFNAASELILCESLIDALTFWVHGFRNVTASFGTNGFTDELLAALKDYSIEKLFIAYDNDEGGNKIAAALAEKLQEDLPQLQLYRVQFPEGMDANEYALKVKPAEQSLDRLLRQAQPMNSSTDLQQQSNVVEQGVDTSLLVVPTPHVNLQSDIDKKPVDDCPLTITETEIKCQLGNRSYRIRGLEKNTSLGQLKINLLVQVGDMSKDGRYAGAPGGSAPVLLHVDTVDLYQSRQRNSFIQQASVECAMDEKKLKNDLGKLLLKLERLQEENHQKNPRKQG
ncbi:hypothetical protein AB835_14235 [Candidatus Endobugula sertula]|uniref:Toprim domain-containing protein n=1 Tax=Candidatus Endobugula sertula TaxID=62101 RepID=A0A1D2QLG9_9GAMM|nr:hypothetical protein AB835_14235 [Candidatus Endobugula sertula]